MCIPKRPFNSRNIPEFSLLLEKYLFFYDIPAATIFLYFSGIIATVRFTGSRSIGHVACKFAFMLHLQYVRISFFFFFVSFCFLVFRDLSLFFEYIYLIKGTESSVISPVSLLHAYKLDEYVS